MLALATILSIIPLVQLPYGGSITAFSMLPVILIAYRRGWRWGLFTGLAFSLLQLLLGMNNLSYATSYKAAAAIIVLDYLFAFAVLGLGGVFRKIFRSQGAGLTAGVLLVCALRYATHVITGCTVWAGVSIPSADGLLYSLAYNATYMIPETLITVAGAVALSRVLDFRGNTITRAPTRRPLSPAALVCSIVSVVALTAAAVTDVVLVFSKLQNSDGVFDITLLSTVNWPVFGIVTAAGAVVAGALVLIRRAVFPSEDA